MRRLILHVGPHKTGTTSIQRALFFAAKELPKLGIYYPSEWLSAENRWSHYALFKQIRGKDLQSLAKNTAEVLKTDANVIVLSAEDLCLLSVEEIHLMSQAFLNVEADLEISVVFYVRRWSGVIPSVAQELIKHGISSTLSDIVAQELMAPERSDILNYVNRLDRFSTVLGADAINLIAFDNVLESKENLVDNFFRTVLSCARTKSDTYDVETQHNRSLSIFEVEFLRVHNCLVKIGAIPKFAGNADEYLQRLRALDFQQLAIVMQGSVRGLDIDETALPFSALYDALHAKYQCRFLNPMGLGAKDPLFRRVQRKFEFIHPNYLCDIGVLNSLIALNQNIIGRPA